MADKQVIFIDSVHPVLEQKLEQAGMVCLQHTKTNIETLQTILPEAYGIVIRSRFTIDTDFLKFCPNLKFIARSGSGLENIDIKICKDLGVRVSLFVEAEENAIENAYNTGTDRIELYTGPYAAQYPLDKQEAIASYRLAALRAKELGLGINAGHDLSFDNLHYFKSQLIQLDEVSIGHAIISEALYLGIENCIQLYKNELIR